MKSAATKAVLLVTLFGASFAGARFASRPAKAGTPESNIALSGPPRLSALQEEPVYEDFATGFSSAIGRLEEIESAMARGDYQTVIESGRRGSATSDWADSDPEGMWRWLQSGDAPGFGSNIYYSIFQNWFKRDPDAALDALRKTDDSGRHAGRFALLYLIFDEDPEVARVAGERLGEFIGNARPAPGEPSENFFSQGRDALEKLIILPDSPAKDRLVRVTLAGWFRNDWRGAKDWAAAQPEEVRANMERFLFTHGIPVTVKRDSEAFAWALDWLERDENRDIRARVGKEVAFALAEQNPTEAVQWAGENLSGAPLSQAVAAIVTAQFKQDPATATEFVDALPPGGMRLQAGRSLIGSLRRSDPLAAFERAWGEHQSGFDVGREQWRDVGGSLALKEPVATREILTNPPEELPPAFEDASLSDLFREDPETTMNWATQLSGERGKKIAERILRSWKSTDPAAAEKWEKSP